MKFFEALSGNTPLIRIDYRLDGRPGAVYAKLESFNLSGSIKDRVAARVIARAEAAGTLVPGQPIVEVTSGNTGIAFAALGALTGHPVHIFMPERMSRERRQLLEMYGAQLHLVSDAEGGFEGALALARDAAAQMNAFQPLQFDNEENVLAHYHTTGAELLAALPGVKAFAAGVGTGGTLMGVARRLKPQGAFIAALEPDSAPLLSGGRVTGPHKIEGIGDDFIPSIVDRRLIDTVVVMNGGKIQQIGTPEDIYNEPKNAFVADFIGDSNIIDGVMHRDFLVSFAGVQFPCVDRGFKPEQSVQVVVRPEDIEVVSPMEGQLTGEVNEVIFKGVHFEMHVDCDGREWLIHSTRACTPGERIGMRIGPNEIHIMARSEG